MEYNFPMWYVYVILCEDGSLYTGFSNNPEARFERHKKGRGATYTRIHKPIRILHIEQFEVRIDALHREIEIKSWGRADKIKRLNLKLEE